MPPRLPLRLRVTLAFAAGMAAVLAAVGAFVYVRTGADLLDQVDSGLRSRGEVLASQVAASGPDIPPISIPLIERDEAFAQIAGADGRILRSSEIVASTPLLQPGIVRSIRARSFFDRRIPGIDDVTRILAVPVMHADARYVLLVGGSLQDRRDAMLQLAATLAIGGPLALALISFSGWLVVGAALRPVERMRAHAAAISTLEPDQRLPVPPGDDELARLASTLNAMLARLEEAFARERRFVDDASHELRTPLAVLHARLELALSRARRPEELEESVRRSLADVQRLSRLAEDLLVYSRAEGGRIPIHREEVALGELVREAVEPHRGRALALGVRIDVESVEAVAELDPIRVRQVVGNLVENAIRHAGPDGTVRVSADRADGQVRIEVRNSGRGFPPDLLPTAFEPFTRGARDRNEPGAGLGLAIVRAVALAHGGTASAENPPGGGASVTVTLRA